MNDHLNLTGIERLGQLKALKGKGIIIESYLDSEIKRLCDVNRCPAEFKKEVIPHEDDYPWIN